MIIVDEDKFDAVVESIIELMNTATDSSPNRRKIRMNPDRNRVENALLGALVSASTYKKDAVLLSNTVHVSGDSIFPPDRKVVPDWNPDWPRERT